MKYLQIIALVAFATVLVGCDNWKENIPDMPDMPEISMPEFNTDGNKTQELNCAEGDENCVEIDQ